MRRIFSIILIAAFSIVASMAQSLGMTDVIPADSTIRMGTLASGAKYYIKSNKKDPQRADFHILYDVGAIQEENDQDGLAHFLEHMAFNGSKNFKDNAMIDYMRTIGVRFGENLNAETGQETTTYRITEAPITRPGIVDSILLVLHDWAGFISLENEDIDKERGVIREELRLQVSSPGYRTLTRQAPVLFNNSIYSRRFVIGTDSLLKSFDYQRIKDFYHKWYRPDLQCFVIVGDFDAAEMEAKLKTVMADVKPFEVQTPKEKVVIEENDSLMVDVVSDPELTINKAQVVIRFKAPNPRYNDRVMAVKTNIVNSLIDAMLAERFEDLKQNPATPFVDAGAGYGGFVNGYNHFAGVVYAKDNRMKEAVEALYTELYRMQRGGFTQSELDRAVAQRLANLEDAYKNRNDRKNGAYCDMLVSAFYDNTPIGSMETMYPLEKELVEKTSLEEVNAAAAKMIRDKASSLTVAMVAKEGNAIPTEAELITLVNKVKASDIEIKKDTVAAKPLIPHAVKGGKVVKTEAGEFGSTVWTLSNGIRVVYKKTDLKADDLQFDASQKGGKATISDIPMLYSSDYYEGVAKMSGLGEFTAPELSKQLAGKNASASPYIDNNYQGFKGSCVTKDAETMFQLLYLQATAARIDSTGYGLFKRNIETMLPNMLKNPDVTVQDSMRAFYNYNPRIMPLTMEAFDKIQLDVLKQLNKKFFSDYTDMVFVMVGSMEADSLKPLVAKYVGALPTSKIKPAFGTNYTPMVKGKVNVEYAVPMEAQKVTALVIYSGDGGEKTLDNFIKSQALNSILEIRYTKSIREEAGGSYSVGTIMQMDDLPVKQYRQIVVFNTDSAKVQKLLPIVYKEINDLMTNGPKAEDLEQVKENMKKNFSERNNSNGTWVNYLSGYYLRDRDSYTDFLKVVDGLTVENMRDRAKVLYDQGNIFTLVQSPAAK